MHVGWYKLSPSMCVWLVQINIKSVPRGMPRGATYGSYTIKSPMFNSKKLNAAKMSILLQQIVSIP
jgi:hypothetical protein